MKPATRRERIYGSAEFIARTRNPKLAADPPQRFEPTKKAEGDLVL